jgi:hypothetical protein
VIQGCMSNIRKATRDIPTRCVFGVAGLIRTTKTGGYRKLDWDPSMAFEMTIQHRFLA